MAQRKPFLLRLPQDLLDELSRWARDDLRSVNAQVEYLLREAVRLRRHWDIVQGKESEEEGDAQGS